MDFRKMLSDQLDKLEDIKNDETAEMGAKVIELTKVVLVVALVLIPVGLVTLATTNTTALSTTTVTIIASISVVVVAGVIIMILDGALGKMGRRR